MPPELFHLSVKTIGSVHAEQAVCLRMSMIVGKCYESVVQVQGLDFAQQMLADAERRQQSRHAARSRRYAHVEWVQGDALELPFSGADIP